MSAMLAMSACPDLAPSPPRPRPSTLAPTFLPRPQALRDAEAKAAQVQREKEAAALEKVRASRVIRTN